MTEQTAACPAPGVYRGVPMEGYHAWDAASNSMLGRLAKSPAHAYAYRTTPHADTAALALGRAVHCAVLEADEFGARYVLAEQCKAETKQKKRCSKTGTVPLKAGGFFCATHARQWDDDRDAREVLTPDEWSQCMHMGAAVHSVERASSLIRGLSHTEVSVIWEDAGDTGVLCKCRWDGVADFAGGTILDLKTTLDASPEAFQRSIWKYGYHRQGALYLEGAGAHGIPAKNYAIVAVEKDPPYATAIYRLTEGAIDAGAEQNRRLLATYAECLESGHWPGYADGQVQDIGLPDWAWKQLEA